MRITVSMTSEKLCQAYAYPLLQLNPTSMKRNENIVPLSRDHHFGLLFCWKIREGLKRNVDPERIKRFIAYYWDHHFSRHFHEEETILFILKDDPYCRRAREEHKIIGQLVEDLAQPDSNTTLLQSIADMVDQHIRYEERELFPYLEQTLTENQLAAIGKELEELHAEKPADEYADEFWLKAKS